jgi:hypothetical protein
MSESDETFKHIRQLPAVSLAALRWYSFAICRSVAA